MALIKSEICCVCGETKEVNAHTFSGVCSDCQKTQADAEKRRHLAGLKGLTVEERLERIEELLYDTDAEARLKSLEAKTETYA